MKRVLIASLPATAALMAGAAQASADKASAAGCMKCHDVERKKLAAPFKDIAARNRGNQDYVDAMVKKLARGSGHPKSAASEAELKAIMDWIVKL